MKNRVKKAVQRFKDIAQSFAYDQKGIGVVEIILILVILIGLVLIFKNQITSIISSAFDSISVNSDSIVK